MGKTTLYESDRSGEYFLAINAYRDIHGNSSDPKADILHSPTDSLLWAEGMYQNWSTAAERVAARIEVCEISPSYLGMEWKPFIRLYRR